MGEVTGNQTCPACGQTGTPGEVWEVPIPKILIECPGGPLYASEKDSMDPDAVPIGTLRVRYGCSSCGEEWEP